MTIKRLFAILFIFICTAVAWFILGGALETRTARTTLATSGAVLEGWGPPMVQHHPVAFYQSPTTRDGRVLVRPISGQVGVVLKYAPKRKGLIWHRTYDASFRGEYVFENPTPIAQTLYVSFSLPSPQATYRRFSFQLNGRTTTANVNGKEPITEAVVVAPGSRATLAVTYETRGVDRWGYLFADQSRIQNFALGMETDFAEIDFPPGTASPSERQRKDAGWKLTWSYSDEIGARGIGMDMPNVLNPGPTASRITFFAPISLLFFFAVLIVICLLQRIDLHPMNFFFLAAGCFAFQLLFAYLVDLIPLGAAFAISAAMSLVMVSGYLWLARGLRLARLAALAQFGYMVLFSYSFFFDGLTGITITIGAIVTLAILMVATAKVNWSEKFTKPALVPPVLPRRA